MFSGVFNERSNPELIDFEIKKEKKKWKEKI